MGLNWSEPTAPNDECRYTHVQADTPLGVVRIEWKGWKDYDDPTCQLPLDLDIANAFIVGNDLEDAKRKVEGRLMQLADELKSALK